MIFEIREYDFEGSVIYKYWGLIKWRTRDFEESYYCTVTVPSENNLIIFFPIKVC